MTSKDMRFMELAKYIGQWSKDPDTKVGCVIVGPGGEVRATGYNGLPRGANDDVVDRLTRPLKYAWIEHAERNAIYNATLSGVTLRGCRIYIPWFPCMDCARAIVQVGIVDVVAFKPDPTHPRWGQDFMFAEELFNECGLTITYLDSL